MTPNPSSHPSPDGVGAFYESKGWTLTDQGNTQDALLNEDLRPCAADYVRRCRLRVLRYLPLHGDKILDMASGPIQYPEYLEYSIGYRERHCVDLSQRALDLAKVKLSDHGRYHCGNFLDMEFEENEFDACVSLHTIYHIPLAQQESAVKKLLRHCRVGQPVVVVTKNPQYVLLKPVRCLKRLIKGCYGKDDDGESQLYHDCWPLSFWTSFEGQARVEIFPWRSLSARHQKMLFPRYLMGRWGLSLLFVLEDAFPRFFVRYFKFYTVVLTKC